MRGRAWRQCAPGVHTRVWRLTRTRAPGTRSEYRRVEGAPLSAMRAPKSVRTYLVGLIFGVLLPLLGFSGFLVMRSAEREQDAIAATARNRTRIAATVIEDEISALRARLFLLAGG